MKKQKYTRKDERVHTWHLSSLAHGPSTKKQNFQSLSDLAMFKSLKHRPKPIHFPASLYHTPNYFHQPWSLNTHRRIKNIIVAVEWCPDRRAVKVVEQGDTFGTAAPTVPGQPDRIIKTMTPEQDLRLKKSFDLFDTDKNGEIDKFEMRELLRALEAVTENGEDEFGPLISHILATSSTNHRTLTFDDVKKMMMNTTHGRIQSGRYYVVVSLQEAESLRGWIHLQRNASNANPPAMIVSGTETTIGLRVGSYLLDGSHKYVPALPYQQDTAEACLRFADSDVFYAERPLNLLLHAMQSNTLEARRQWFDDVRSCKRRQQKPWERTSLVRLFTMPDEFHLLEHKALVSRVRTLIRLKGMLMMDAFRAFDVDRDGRLNCSELYAAAHWLGLTELTPNDIYDMMKNYDSTGSGTMNYHDFSKTFRDPDEEQDIYVFVNAQLSPAGLDTPGAFDINNIVIPPMKIKELYDLHKVEKKTFKNRIIPPEVLAALKVKLKPIPQWEKVWTSEGTNSRHQVSIWEVTKALTLWERSNKMRVSLGHYAVSGFLDPSKDKKYERLTLEFTDTSTLSIKHSEVLEMAVEQLVPHPIKYVQVWHQELGSVQFYAWYVEGRRTREMGTVARSMNGDIGVSPPLM